MVEPLTLDDSTALTMVAKSASLLKENHVAEAREYLNRALQIDATSWRAHALLAEAYLREGSPKQAVEHAKRALELGQGQAAAVSPLLARALTAEATDVLRSYLTDHPDDMTARNQLETLAMGSELRSPGGADPPARSSAAAAAPAKSPDSFVRPAWVPASATLPVTPVEPGSACNLKEVMDMAGQRIREFVDNVQRFTATESLEHESINKSGDVTRSEKRIYDYVVSIDELRPGILDVEEYQTAKSARDSTPQDVINLGLPALLLVFHPYNWETFWMSCEGVATLNGRKVWQIYFRQREDQPNKIRSYKLGFNGPSYRVDLHGWAWFDLNSFQIIRLQADLIKAIPDIQLAVDHTSVEYGPVTFSSRKTEMWVPQTGEFFSERKGKRFHERMSFSDYLLFAVDEKQKIADPKENP